MTTLTSPHLRAASGKRVGAPERRARKPRDLAVLMEVAAWREREAQSRDVPRSRVLKDDVLDRDRARRAAHAPALGNLRAFPRGMERSRAGAEILAASSADWRATPRPCRGIERERRSERRATVELLKVLLRQVAESNGVAAKMIATVDDLEAIAADDQADVPALTGWRRDLFGEKALR